MQNAADFAVSATPLRKRRLSDQIHARILLQLSAGRYQVGERLPTEKEIAACFDVSRPVVREALQGLQKEGLIEARRGSGTFVRRLPPHKMAHFADDAGIAQYLRAYEVRRGVEGEAARLAAQRINRSHRESLQQALVGMEDGGCGGDKALEADFQFHLAIARATENDLFEKQLLFLRTEMMETMRIAAGLASECREQHRKHVFCEHRDIVQAICRGDSEMAKMYMHYHLTSVRNLILDSGEPVA